MITQQYSIRLENSHSEAFALWWDRMEDLKWVSTSRLSLNQVKAESMHQNRWSADLATYFKASQTQAILLAYLGATPIGHVLAAIYENKTGWVGLLGRRVSRSAVETTTLIAHTL
jgi:hypothetical protein